VKVTEQDILSLISEALTQSLGEQDDPPQRKPPVDVELTPAARAAQARIKANQPPASWAQGDEGSEWLGQFRNWATLNPRRAKRVNKKLEKAGVKGGLQATDNALAQAASNLYGGRKLRQTRPEWYPSREEGPEKFGGAPDPRVFIPGYNIGKRIKQGRAAKKASVERGRGIRDPQRAAAAPEGKTNIDYFELMDAVEDGRINYRQLGNGDEEAGRTRVAGALEQAYGQASDKVKADIDLSREQGATRRAAKKAAGTFSYSGTQGASAQDAQRAIKQDYDEARSAVKGDGPTVFDLPPGVESGVKNLQAPTPKADLPGSVERARANRRTPKVQRPEAEKLASLGTKGIAGGSPNVYGAPAAMGPSPGETRAAKKALRIANRPARSKSSAKVDPLASLETKGIQGSDYASPGDMGEKPEGEILDIPDLDEQLGRWKTLAGLP
tara:strand:- start:1103 stop:2425 length:1323 start_codon:yes stop_codon:yes gene_type:complete